jgi:hypothetical protein
MLCSGRNMEEHMSWGRTQGRYRTVPDGKRTPMAFVIDGASASYVTEAVYRAKGYSPDFDKLPTEDEYDA